MVGLALSQPCERSFQSRDPRYPSGKTSARALFPMRQVSESSMKQSRAACPQTVGDERADVAARIVDYLRARYPQKTAQCVAADLDMSVSTVQKWFERTSAPSLRKIPLMVHVYGPEFLAALLGSYAPDFLRREAHVARRAEIEAKVAALQQELSTL